MERALDLASWFLPMLPLILLIVISYFDLFVLNKVAWISDVVTFLSNLVFVKILGRPDPNEMYHDIDREVDDYNSKYKKDGCAACGGDLIDTSKQAVSGFLFFMSSHDVGYKTCKDCGNEQTSRSYYNRGMSTWTEKDKKGLVQIYRGGEYTGKYRYRFFTMKMFIIFAIIWFYISMFGITWISTR